MSYVNRGSILALGVVFSITSIIAVGARFAVRIHHRMLGIDDWLCLVAMFLVLGECAIFITGYATHSLGTHTPPMGPELLTLIEPSMQTVKKLEYSAYCLFIPALTLLKLSTLFFYRRLFRGKAFTIAFWILSVTSVIWGFSFLVAWADGCKALEDHWLSIAVLRSKCINTFTVIVCQSVSDVFVDLALLILPIPFVFALKMPVGRKIAVCATLLVGALAIGCGTYRMVIVVQTLAAPFLANPTVAGMRATDAAGIVSALAMWSMLELGVGIVAVCLPTLRTLLHQDFRKSLAQSFRSLVRPSFSDRSSQKTMASEQLKMDPEAYNFEYVSKEAVSTIHSSFDATTVNSVTTQEGGQHTTPEGRIVVERTYDVATVD